MPPKPKATNWNLIGKMAASFLVISVGGPAFTFWLVPSEEELFKKYNPDLQKKSLENREQKQEEFDHFVTKLKEYSKSDKHIWEVAADAERAEKAGRVAEQARMKREMRERQEELRQTNQR